MIKGIFYLLILMSIFLGVILHQTDIEYGTERNIFNYTETQIDLWNSSDWEVKKLNHTNISMQEAFTFRATNVIYKLIDLIGYSAIQVIKLGTEFGYEKAYDYEPENFVFIAKLIFVVVIISFIIPVIIPVLALIYLLFEGLKWTINKFKNKDGKD